jgi:FkbM family methyltransferase
MSVKRMVESPSGWWSLDGDRFLGRDVLLRDRIDVQLLELQTMWPHILGASTLVDVGANIGCWTVPMLRAVRSGGSVISFEPDPAIFECLKRNVENEKAFGKNSDLRPAAVTSKSNHLGFLRNLDNPGAGGLHYSPHPPSATLERLEVETQTLDALMDRYQRIDFIKIDVEGEEVNVLESGTELIRRDLPVIFIEANPAGLKWRDQTVEDLSHWLSTHGYSITPFPEQNPHDFICLPKH